MTYSTDIKYAEFDENGIATKAGWAIVYRYRFDTKEYIGADYDNVPFGGGVVGDSCLDKPELPTEAGIAIIRSDDEKSWLHVSDYRGKTAHKTENRQPIIIDFIGGLPETLTLLEPQTEFDKWNGKKWVTDTESQKASLIVQAEYEKAQRLEEANKAITDLQDAIDVGLALDGDVEKLQEWKKYRVLLNRVDTSLAPDIDWPQKP